MLQTTKPIRRRSKQESAPAFLDPATIKERFYGLTLKGDCLDPVFKDGVVIVVDRDGPPEVGCFAVFYYRPELVPPGFISPAIKRLVTAVPPLKLPYKLAPDSDCCPIIMVEQLKPAKRWWVSCDHLLAVHRCVGSASDPEVLNMLAAEGWRI